MSEVTNASEVHEALSTQNADKRLRDALIVDALAECCGFTRSRGTDGSFLT